MKKLLLSGLLMLGGFAASAQLADGTVAPDFTVTDLNGTEHSLSAYLAEGKTVMLYCSATWCGPCWQYHNTHYLEEVYNKYGEGGSDEVVILYVETDPATPVEHLYGENTPAPGAQGPPQGNWVEDTPYPIINSDQISEDYQISYFPTLYRICPETGKVTEIERAAPAPLMASLENACHEVEGIPGWADINAGDLEFCEATASIKANITSYTGDLTSVKAKLFKNDEQIAEETFAVDVDPFSTGLFAFDAAEFDSEAAYHVELVEVNGMAPYAFEEDELSSTDFTVQQNMEMTETSNNITVTVWTDRYPGEMSWVIVDEMENVIAREDYNGPVTGGGFHANKVKVHNVILPEGTGCYSVVLIDDFADGWDGDSELERTGIRITSGDGTVIYDNDGTGDWQIQYDQAAFQAIGALSTDRVEAKGFAIYPNPSNGIFNFATEEEVDVTVLDITGKVVHTAKGIGNGGVLDLSGLQSGVYVAKIKGATSEMNEKLIIR